MRQLSPEAPWRAEVLATARLAAPLVLTNLSQAAIQATDVVLLGWLGAHSLAAAVLGSNLYIAFLVFGMGLVTAASPLLASELGARRHSVREVRRTVRQALWAAASFAIPVWLILWHAQALLGLLGQEPGLSADAARFVRPLMWGLAPALAYLVLRAFVAALERPLWSLGTGIIGVVFNAGLNYALIFGKFGLPRLGLVGAGLGSSCTQSLMCLVMALVIVMHPRFRRYRLFGRWWRSDWARYARIWQLGAPIAVTLGLEVTIFSAAVFLMGLIGADALAAHAIALQIASVTFMVPLGLGQAATVRVGLAFGRGDAAGIARAGWTAWVLAVGFMAVTACVMYLTSGALIGVFIDRSDPGNTATVRLATSFLAVAALFQVVDAAQAVGAGMLRGLQDTTVPMIFAAAGYWVIGLGVALWLAFGAGWGGLGIWVGLATGLAVVAVLVLVRWMRRDRRLTPA